MDNNILNRFLEKTYYKTQINRRFNALKGFLQNKFFNSPLPKIDPEEEAWIKSLGEDFYKNFTKLNVYQLLSKLEKDIKTLQTLTVYLSFDLPDEEKDRLGVWLRANFKKDLVFEIRLDQALIGGAALSWKGVYKDYSLRSRIDQNRDKIMASLKNYM